MLRKISPIISLIGILIFIYIIIQVGISDISKAFMEVDFFLMLVLCPIFIITITLLRAYKWKVIVESLARPFHLYAAVKAILIGFFAGFITPGRVGDAFRSVYVSQSTKMPLIKSFSTVFIDRFIDLVILLVLGIVSILIFSFSYNNSIFYGFIFISIFGLIALLMIIKKKTVRFFLKPFYNLIVPAKYKKKISTNFNAFFDALLIYANNKKVIVTVVMLNIINWFIIFLYMYAIAVIAGLDVSLPYILLISPIITLVEIIPITIGGLGTREATLVFLFSLVGISSSNAVTYSLLYMVLAGWTFSILGAIFWIKSPIRI